MFHGAAGAASYTTSVPEPHHNDPLPSADEIRAELARVLSSTLFVSANRVSRFLRFVVGRFLEDGSGRIKESVLGREVFDRLDAFDPSIDAIVRVEATRLRSKLHRYFRTEGLKDPITISLKKGSYLPVIRWRKKAVARRDSAAQTPAIAVLPFHNASNDPALDFLCEGLAEESVHALAQVHGLRVIAWNSTRKLKGAVYDIRFVAEQLHVSAVVEGSIRQVDGHLRIAVQLVETAECCCLWSEVFESSAGDVLVLREKIARAVAAALMAGRVSHVDPRIPARGLEKPEIHNYYLKGKYHLNRRTAEGLAKATEYFEKLIAAEPEHARGHAGLAEALVLRVWYGHAVPNQVMPLAKAAALKAVKADSRLSQAHLSLGLVMELFDWDWARARQALRLAIDLEPGSATALFEYGLFLGRMGELDEALVIIRRAQGFDPLSPVINTNLGVIYYYQRNLKQAISQYAEALELDSAYQPAHYRLALAYLQQGMTAEAHKRIEKGLRLPSASPHLLALSGYTLARSGRKDRAHSILDALLASSGDRYVSPVSIAILCLGINETGQALDWLEHAREEHDVLLVDIKVDPLFHPLRVKPGFCDLLNRLNLGLPTG